MLIRCRYILVTAMLLTLTLIPAPLTAFAQDIFEQNIPLFDLLQVNVVLIETFDSETAWETYIDPMGIELGVDDHVYRAYSMNAGYVWALNAQSHSDVIIEVEATPMNVHFENGFGVMCRADSTNNGDGYYFMINSNGYYSIGKGEGPAITPLIDWTRTDTVHQQLDLNRIRAVCDDNLLALYVNDVFVAQVNDDTYTAGYAGLAIAGSATGEADIAFDNLIIYEVLAP